MTHSLCTRLNPRVQEVQRSAQTNTICGATSSRDKLLVTDVYLDAAGNDAYPNDGIEQLGNAMSWRPPPHTTCMGMFAQLIRVSLKNTHDGIVTGALGSQRLSAGAFEYRERTLFSDPSISE